MAARAYFEAGNHAEAGRLSREVNRVRPAIDTLLLEAKVRRQEQDFAGAIRLLSEAEQWLSGNVRSGVDAGGSPHPTPADPWGSLGLQPLWIRMNGNEIEKHKLTQHYEVLQRAGGLLHLGRQLQPGAPLLREGRLAGAG